jgi:CRP-like cAMP-binding protein
MRAGCAPHNVPPSSVDWLYWKVSPTRDPFERLFATIAPTIESASDDGAYLRSLFGTRHLAKGEFYQRAGDITTHGGFVVSGVLRTYTIDAEGDESIIYFSPERSWVGDIQSARTGRSTAYHVDAVEPAELLMIALVDFDRLLARVPEIARQYQLGLERTSAARERRIALALNSTAEERYVDFVERYPSIAMRVPQRMLASYLGMSPETLSRVRHRLRKR